MSKEKFKKLVGNKFFTVEFTKKNGEYRILTGRLGVKKYLKNGKNTTLKDNLVKVYDIKNKGYRTINLENWHVIKANGKKHFNILSILEKF